MILLVYTPKQLNHSTINKIPNLTKKGCKRLQSPNIIGEFVWFWNQKNDILSELSNFIKLNNFLVFYKNLFG